MAQLKELSAEDQKVLDGMAGLLDGTLDDIADLPEFKTFPSGVYKTVILGFATKVINKHPAVELKLQNKEVIELANAAEQAEAPKVDDEMSMAFMMDNEIGQGFYKLAMMPIAERLGTKVPREVMEGAKGLEVVVVISRTYDKDKQRHYGNLKKLEVA